MNLRRMWTVARTDLKQLIQARDYWIPMVALGALFFLVVPAVLLLTIRNIGEVTMVQQISDTLKVLPKAAQAQIQGSTPEAKTSYALSVFLFAPIAVVVPLTISTAVGAAKIVGERERGTGEFLAHSPATAREIYTGKLLASLIPGYLTTIVGFGLYSLLVNVIAGPEVGHWFFPTPQWLILMLWVIPPFLAFTLSLVLRLSAKVKSTAAAQQASGLVSLPLIGLAYGQSSGALFGAQASGWIVGAVAWIIAAFSLTRGVRSVTRARLLGVANEV
ncbi:MAG TPA: ABC transporter permease subunit [Microthrixaceae bacterium]|nr:ABC transporter permease subunit [Microthrixaceae bacterium]